MRKQICVGATLLVVAFPVHALAKPCEPGSNMSVKTADPGGHTTFEYHCWGGTWVLMDSYHMSGGSSRREGGRGRDGSGSGGVIITGGSLGGGERGSGGMPGGPGGGGGGNVAKPDQNVEPTVDGRYRADGVDPRGRPRAAAATKARALREAHRTNGEQLSSYLTSTGAPPPPRGRFDASHPCMTTRNGSIVMCQSQTLGETIPLAGTGIALHYHSESAIGYRARNRIDVPLTGRDLPVGLRRVVARVHVAGQDFTEEIVPRPNRTFSVDWDGRDTDGSYVTDGALADVMVGYMYSATFAPPPEKRQAIMSRTRVDPGTFRGGATYTHWTTDMVPVGAWDPRLHALGGWTLTYVFAFNPKTYQLREGTGTTRHVPDATCSAHDGADCTEWRVHSESGQEMYVFDRAGDPLGVESTLTGAPIVAYSWQPAPKRLVRIRALLDGRETSFRYDASGRIEAVTAPTGARTELAYDANGFLSEVRHPTGLPTRLEYRGTSGLLTVKREPRSSVNGEPGHGFSYSCEGLLTTDLNPDGDLQTLTRTGRNATGHTVRRTRPHVQGETFTVARAPFATAPTETWTHVGTNGVSVSSTRSLVDSRTSSADAMGVTTETEFAPHPLVGLGARVPRKQVLTRPSGARMVREQEVTIDAVDPSDPRTLRGGRTVTRLSAGGATREWTATFDALRGLHTVRSPEGRVVSQRYDARGRLVEEQHPGETAVVLSYDDRGRPLAVTHGGRQRAFRYDARGRLERVSVGDRTVQLDDFDPFDLPRRIVAPSGATFSLFRDGNENLGGVHMPGGPQYGLFTSAGGKAMGITLPDVGSGRLGFSVSYNPSGFVDTVRRPDGVTMTMAYDDAGRIAGMRAAIPALADAVDVGRPSRIGYGPRGEVSEVDNESGPSLTFHTDDGLASGSTLRGEVQGSVLVARDAFMRPAGVSVAGRTLSVTYDGDDLITQVGGVSLGRGRSTGRIEAVGLGGATEQYGFAPSDGTLRSATTTHAGAVVYALDVGLHTAGEVAEVTERDATGVVHRSFERNVDGRISRVRTQRGATETISEYRYDARGNRISAITPRGSVSGADIVVDARDQLTRYGSLSFTHTKNGERATVTDPIAGTTEYQYTVSGELAEARLPDGRIITYVLDPFGRRVGKKVDGTLREGYLYHDGGRPIAKLGPDGTTVVARYVYATNPHVPDAIETGGRRYRVLSDHVGSVRIVVDADSGAVAQRREYDEFGNVIFDSAPDFQPFGFAGGLWDADTRLLHLGAREYDPVTGRMLSPDPLGLHGGSNLYEYALGDPASFIDPSGFDADSGWKLSLGLNVGSVSVSLSDESLKLSVAGRIKDKTLVDMKGDRGLSINVSHFRVLDAKLPLAPGVQLSKKVCVFGVCQAAALTDKGRVQVEVGVEVSVSPGKGGGRLAIKPSTGATLFQVGKTVAERKFPRVYSYDREMFRWLDTLQRWGLGTDQCLPDGTHFMSIPSDYYDQ